MTAPFTRTGFARGFRDGLAPALAIVVYGVAFGVVAVQAGLSVVQATTTSALVNSGSAQLAAMSLMGAGIWTVVATILVMNARYLMFGAALQPWLAAAGPSRAWPSLLMLGDANWLMTMRAIDGGERDRAYLAGSGTPMLGGWWLGTAAGAAFGSVLPDPQALGADMMLACFAAGMVAAMQRQTQAWGAAATGIALALLVEPVAGIGPAIIAAGLGAGALAMLRHG